MTTHNIPQIYESDWERHGTLAQQLPVASPVATTTIKKTPLAEAASMLTELCDRIDQGENLDHVLMAAFTETKLELAEAVDRRLAFDIWAKGALEAARQARDEWDKRVQLLKALHDRFKERTKEIVEAHPDLPYQGKLGCLRLQRNGPAVRLAFGDKDITPDMISYFGIAPEFVKVTYEIRKKDVLAALKSGKEITWAALKTDGKQLRFGK